MASLQTGIEIMVFVGVYMKWIRPIVDKLFNIDAPASYLDSPEEQKRKR